METPKTRWSTGLIFVFLVCRATLGGEPLPANWCATAAGPGPIGPDCTRGTCDPPAERNRWLVNPSTTMLTIRIKFFVLADDSGLPATRVVTDQQIDAQLQRVNLLFQQYHIRFEQVSPHSVIASTDYKEFCWEDNTPYTCLEAVECRGLIGDEYGMKFLANQDFGPLSGQLNVFVTDVKPDLPIGIGYFTWCQGATDWHGGVVMDKEFVGGLECGALDNLHCRTLVHEIGHVLGLFHTFTGSDEVGCNACSEKPACDGTCSLALCDEVGDLCCDTAGMPGLRPPPDMCSQPVVVGLCNDIYTEVDDTNHMSYGGDVCTNHFTAQQRARMQCWACDRLSAWIDAPSGACCVGSSCITTPEPCCVNQGGIFGGAGSTCENCVGTPLADACEFPVGACCIGGVCTVRGQTCCTNAGGSFKGTDTDCRDCSFNGVADECEFSSAAKRACCLEEGYLCELRHQACCELDEGTFYEFDTFSGQCALLGPQQEEPKP